jgi:hypothetical protein
MIKSALVIVTALTLSSPAFAGDTCKAQAAAKNLHGAAETSFVAKCSKDSTAKCDADAKAKNLHGAAETSFKKKCMSDAAG